MPSSWVLPHSHLLHTWVPLRKINSMKTSSWLETTVAKLLQMPHSDSGQQQKCFSSHVLYLSLPLSLPLPGTHKTPSTGVYSIEKVSVSKLHLWIVWDLCDPYPTQARVLDAIFPSTTIKVFPPQIHTFFITIVWDFIRKLVMPASLKWFPVYKYCTSEFRFQMKYTWRMNTLSSVQVCPSM